MKNFIFTLLLISMLTPLTFSQSNQNCIVQWQKCYGGSNWELAKDIISTSDGGYIALGYTMSDDGDVSIQKGYSDLWVIKVDSSGNLEWEKTYGGSMHEHPGSILQTGDGGYIIFGSSSSTDGDISSVHGFIDLWILKINEFGNILWEKTYGGTEGESSKKIIQCSDGGFIVCSASYSSNGDVPFSYTTNGYNNLDAWIFKIDSIGTLLWSKVYGGTGQDEPFDIIEAYDGGFIFVGWAISNDYEATGCGAFPITSQWLVKLDQNGQFEWNKCYNPDQDFTSQLAFIKKKSGNKYIIGGSVFNNGWFGVIDESGSLLFQKSVITGEQTYILDALETQNGYKVLVSCRNEPTNINSIYIYEFDSTGTELYHQKIGGSGFDAPAKFIQNDDGSLLLLAWVGSVDGDVFGNHGLSDFWIAKLSKPNISGLVFLDENLNTLPDATELPVVGQLVELTPGPYYAFTNNQGMYYLTAETGPNTVTFIPSGTWYATGNSFLDFILQNQNQFIDHLDFGINNPVSVTDMGISSVSTPCRPGFDMHLWLHVKNLGTNGSQGTITLKFDSCLSVVTTSHPYISLDSSKITWNYGPFGPGASDIYYISFYCVADTNLLGDTIAFLSNVCTSLNDINPSNNTDTLQLVVTGSYDPNDKNVSPLGLGDAGYVNLGQRLKYKIRFQNTGTDTAFTVVIRDPIDMSLNLRTLAIDAYSHPCEWKLVDQRHLVFTFNNILLPDSNVNEPASHGYVVFSISPSTQINSNTEVRNTAYIFFDFNPPIATNTTLNTFISQNSNLPNFPGDDEIMLFPNPGSDILNIVSKFSGEMQISLFDLSGKKLFSTSTDNQNLKIDVSDLSAGMYFIIIKHQLGMSSAKFIKQ